MLGAVVQHVTALAERREVAGRVVGGVVVSVRRRQHDARQAHLPEQVFGDEPMVQAAPASVTPRSGLRIPPAAVGEHPDAVQVRPAAILAAGTRAPEADDVRELRPVDGVEAAVLAPDRHGSGWPAPLLARLDRVQPGHHRQDREASCVIAVCVRP